VSWKHTSSHAYFADRFRMACMIFIVFFAPSLSVLAFGEFMCGVAWGVFQVRVSTPTFHAPDHER
jgi:hypothetical protein